MRLASEGAWVVGHRIDDRFRVTESTRRVLVVSSTTEES